MVIHPQAIITELLTMLRDIEDLVNAHILRELASNLRGVQTVHADPDVRKGGLTIWFGRISVSVCIS